MGCITSIHMNLQFFIEISKQQMFLYVKIRMETQQQRYIATYILQIWQIADFGISFVSKDIHKGEYITTLYPYARPPETTTPGFNYNNKCDVYK